MEPKMSGVSFVLRCLSAVKDHVFLQVVIAIILSVLLYSSLPLGVISFIYGLSLSMRSILVFILPFLIIGSIISAFADVPREKFWFILMLLFVICIVNFLNLMVSYLFASNFLGQEHSHVQIAEGIRTLKPMFHFNPTPLLKNEKALIIAGILGFISSFFNIWPIKTAGKMLYKICFTFMLRVFIPLLPIFVSGSFLKMLYDGMLKSFIGDHLETSLLMIGFLIFYLILWFLMASGWKISRFKEIFLNIAPAMITAFSTMSSAAALPLSIKAAEENTKDPILAKSVMPISMNLHMCGDTICIPIMIFIVMINFGLPTPDFTLFAKFGLFFVLNKFAGGGIPGGTIMVTAPVMERVLGFSGEMTGLIIAIYTIFDPIATTGNVTANNLFVIFFKKIMGFFDRSYSKSNEAR